MSGGLNSTRDRAHVVTKPRPVQAFDDKENQGPGGIGLVPWAGVIPSPAQTDALDLKINRKAWQRTPGQPGRTVLSDITPLFKRTAVSPFRVLNAVPASHPSPTPHPAPPANRFFQLTAHHHHVLTLAGSVIGPGYHTLHAWFQHGCSQRQQNFASSQGRMRACLMPRSKSHGGPSNLHDPRGTEDTWCVQGFFTDRNVMNDAEKEPMLQGSDSKPKKVS